MVFHDVTNKMYSYDSQSKKIDSYDSQSYARFLLYDIRGKSYGKYDPCYAVPRR